MRQNNRKTQKAETPGALRAGLAFALGSALVLVPALGEAQSRRTDTTDLDGGTGEKSASRSDASFAPSPWSYCERAAIAIEATHKMPRALLVSVSMAEAGRFDAASGKSRPWPWTINAEGQAFYFDTKKEAVAATQRLLKAGIRSIDVGCMQVNLRYHPDAFADLHEAFEPLSNVTYAAGFLKRLHKQSGSWPKAVAQYHSESPIRNEPYFAKVIRIWTGQRERVAELTRKLKEEAAAEVASTLRAQVTETAIVNVVIDNAEPVDARPAPMVLDAEPAQNVREGAVATVGLRLSIADKDFVSAGTADHLPPPRVIEPVPAKPTIVADASAG